MSCKWCKSTDFSSYCVDVADNRAGICYQISDTNQFCFCPMCGEPLGEPKPLTLDELRMRDGSPVYYENAAYLVWWGDDGVAYLQRPFTRGMPRDLEHPTLVDCYAGCIPVEEGMLVYDRPIKYWGR